MAKAPVEEKNLNVEQKKAVSFGDGPLLIIAGAGTGKTTVVTERIKHLISSGRCRPDEILALTFTEKASREMEERVDIALPYGTTQMWISTFHAFCDRVLRTEAINIGLDPGYKLMTEAGTILFFRKNIFKFNLQYFRPLGNPTRFISGMIQHFSRLKDEDVTPIQYLDWIQSVMPDLIRHPVQKRPDSRLRGNDKKESKKSEELEESNKEKIEKYQELAGAYRTYEELKVKEGVADYEDLISNTLKLFRSRKNILKEYQRRFKYILIDEFQDTNFAQNELAILLAGDRQNITVVGDDDQAIYRWRGAAISNIIQFRKHFPKAKIVVLTKNYRSTKEILDRSYRLIQNNNPDRLEVAEKIDKKLESMRRINGGKIEVIYADRVENEAEEVAKEINRLVNVIPSETRDLATKGSASLDFSPSARNDKGEYSWKDFAILVRANNHAEPFVRALSRAGIPYQFLGPGQLFRQPEVKDLIAYLKVLYNFEDNVAMYRVLVMDWLSISPRDVAVLTNYSRKYGLSLFETCEFIASFPTRFAEASARRARSGIQGKSQEKLDSRLRGNDRESSGKDKKGNGNDIPNIINESEQKLKKLVDMSHKHLGLIKKETAGQILYYFLQDTGLLEQFTSYKTTKEEKTANNIAKFFDKLKTYEIEHDDASVFAVVDWIDLSMTLGESPLATDIDWTENNAVNILTVHSAKGLEFPVVFLVNLVGARFPTTERREQIPIPDELVKEILPTGDYHLEEERRLFYVGMTRARDLLYFTAAKYYGEGKREKKLSPFIEEALGKESFQLTANSLQQDKQLTLLDWQKKEEVEAEKVVRQPVTYLSYSQLDTFKTCPLQYKYRYILRIPAPPTAALAFGDSMHKTIRAFYDSVKSQAKPSPEMLVRLLDDYWSPVGYGDKNYEERMKKQGINLLSEYYEKGFDPKVIPVNLEQPFKIKITPLLTFGGKIDRVDELPGGKIEIIDYKTGSAPKNRKPETDLQLTVYALAATDQGIYKKPPEKVIVSFYFFEGQQKISATRTKEQLNSAKQVIAQQAEEISKSDFHPTPGKWCDFCEFRLICEAWQ